MRIIFTVQGDGRGHMTQAISAAQTLEQNGHEVVAVTIGTNPARRIPQFFTAEFGDRIIPIASPGFCFQKAKGVSTLATLGQAIQNLSHYRESLAAIAGMIERTQPDLLINFLEPLTGFLNLVQPHRTPVVSVGHQFMLGHPQFVRSPKFVLQQWAMRQDVRLVGTRSTKLALSFYPADPMPQQRLFPCPPLLRKEVFDLSNKPEPRFLLVYLLNQGYAEEILRWHAVFPDVEVHCFCERPKVDPVWRYDATLSFHKLDGTKFLRMMAESRGVACTAGFESLNEAAWLGKPVLVVPVSNHVEQHLNALDAEKAGLAIAATGFDLTPLLRRQRPRNLHAYRTWVRQAESILLSVIEGATRKVARKFLPSYPAMGLDLRPAPAVLPDLAAARSQSKSCDEPLPKVSSREAAVHC